MDKREILLNLKIVHEQLLKKNYKNGRMQIGIMIKCLEDDFNENPLCERKESHYESGNCNKPLVSVSLLERAATLVGNPGTNISVSTDIACEQWQKDYERWRNER